MIKKKDLSPLQPVGLLLLQVVWQPIDPYHVTFNNGDKGSPGREEKNTM